MMHQLVPVLVAGLMTAGSLVADEKTPSAAGDADAAKTAAQVIFQNLCATCHGTNGEGKAEVKAPSIASLPAWYVERQLENFQADRRGAHPEDAEGQLMRAMAKVLSKEQTSSIALLVEKLPRVKPSPTLKIDVARGKEVYAERCMECHRFNGEGEIVFGAAPLVGLQDWYLAAQLRKFKTGVRGAAQDDENGQKMVKAARNFVEDEEMVQSLAAWLVQLQDVKKLTPSAAEALFGRD
jgi:cytochrome c553